jgi:hypothetical protein
VRRDKVEYGKRGYRYKRRKYGRGETNERLCHKTTHPGGNIKQ